MLTLVAGVCEGLSAEAVAAERPSVLLLMADDLGYSDLGCFGGEIQTPHLDRLAAGGLRFSQFYNAARCCPTRAALLTGQYQHKVGLARNGRSLTRNGATIAELLGSQGYRTAMFGKWHLSFTPQLADRAAHQEWLDHRFDPGQPFAPVETYPVQRGFERHYGIIWGVVNHFDPFSLVDGQQAVNAVPPDYYFTDAITDRAVHTLREFASDSRPFFMYVAFSAPHWPLHARPEDIARYRDRYREGWHALRQERWRRQQELNLFPASTTLPELHGQGPDWHVLSPSDREFQAAKMAVHAAMVDRIDQAVGRLSAALRETGRGDDTLVVFLSDNGASPEVPRNPGYDRNAFTRDGRPMRFEQDLPLVGEVGSEATYLGIGAWWANAANTPFRFWKKESFEGGACTPCIVSWPAGLKTSPGQVTDTVAHVMDWLPTLLDLAGGEYPEEFQGHSLTSLDGRSLAPLLMGRSSAARAPLFFEHEGGRAVRDGAWKLVAHSRTGSAWELYNVAADRTETHDLAQSHAEVVRSLAQQWSDWAAAVVSPNLGKDESR